MMAGDKVEDKQTKSKQKDIQIKTSSAVNVKEN